MTEFDLPVPVLSHPHWRVNFRPASYIPEHLPTLGSLFEIIEKTKIRLRGWDYPHLSRKPGQTGVGNNWVASWAHFLGNLEYWRFYQSGQFLHLFGVREALEAEWTQELKKHARSHLDYLESVNWDAVPGFISFESSVYRFTEIFEFAARLSQHGVYSGAVTIAIRVTGIKGYVLTPGWNRAWSEYRAPAVDTLENVWSVNSADLVGGSADHSLRAIVWFFERFGWLDPNITSIKADQEKFLRGRL
jgi:hypothetical protein